MIILCLWYYMCVGSVFADEGSSNSGLYELQAVLTHKGRSSTSGHYVAWVRHTMSKTDSAAAAAGRENDWIMYDDDNVSVVHPDEILKLSGGGEWRSLQFLILAACVFS